MGRISWLVQLFSASQEEFCPMKLVIVNLVPEGKRSLVK
jgi:hypothetical protein